MAKATTTIRQTLNHKLEHGAWFAANQALFNRVAAFYFEVIQAHETMLELGNQEALTALEQLTHAQTKICAIDLNMGEQIACCTIQTAEGSILATRFIGGGNAVSGTRREAAWTCGTQPIRDGLACYGRAGQWGSWREITHRDDDFAHQVSRRIVQFAREQGASILVFEHLGNVKPEKGRYSHRGNVKRAFWMQGRIFRYAKYKAYHEGGIITCRVNQKQEQEEKPLAPRLAERSVKAEGVIGSQDAGGEEQQSIAPAGHGRRSCWTLVHAECHAVDIMFYYAFMQLRHYGRNPKE
jgi:hypothetical protein